MHPIPSVIRVRLNFEKDSRESKIEKKLKRRRKIIGI